MKYKILRVIPAIGATLIAIVLICLVLCIWGYEPMLNLKLIATSVIGIVVLRILESVLQ